VTLVVSPLKCDIFQATNDLEKKPSGLQTGSEEKERFRDQNRDKLTK